MWELKKKSNQRAGPDHFIYSPQRVENPEYNPHVRDKSTPKCNPAFLLCSTTTPALLARPLGTTTPPDGPKTLPRTLTTVKEMPYHQLYRQCAGDLSPRPTPNPPRGEAVKRAVGRRCASVPSANICPCQARAGVGGESALEAPRREGAWYACFVQMWLAGRAGTGWPGKYILPRVGMARLVTDAVEVWRGFFKREDEV